MQESHESFSAFGFSEKVNVGRKEKKKEGGHNGRRTDRRGWLQPPCQVIEDLVKINVDGDASSAFQQRHYPKQLSHAVS